MRAQAVLASLACAAALQINGDHVIQDSSYWQSEFQRAVEDSAYWEAEYRRVALLGSDDAMIQYIRQLVAHEGKRITSPSELQALVPWYSGTKKVQSFAALTAELAGKPWVVPANGTPAPPKSLSLPSQQQKSEELGAAKGRSTVRWPRVQFSARRPEYEEARGPSKQPQSLAATTQATIGKQTQATSDHNGADGAHRTTGVKRATSAIGDAFHRFARVANNKVELAKQAASKAAHDAVGQAKQVASKAAHDAQQIVGSSIGQVKEAASNTIHRAQMRGGTTGESLGSANSTRRTSLGRILRKRANSKQNKTSDKPLRHRHNASAKSMDRHVVKSASSGHSAKHASTHKSHAAKHTVDGMRPTPVSSLSNSSSRETHADAKAEGYVRPGQGASGNETHVAHWASGKAHSAEFAIGSDIHDARQARQGAQSEQDDSQKQVDLSNETRAAEGIAAKTHEQHAAHAPKTHNKHEGHSPKVLNTHDSKPSKNYSQNDNGLEDTGFLARGQGGGNLSQLIADMRTMLSKTRHHNLVAIKKQRESFEAVLKEQQANITALRRNNSIMLHEIEDVEKSNEKLRGDAQGLRKAVAKLQQELDEIQGNLSTAKEFIDIAVQEDPDSKNHTAILRQLDAEEAAAKLERARRSALRSIAGKEKISLVQVDDDTEVDGFIRSMREGLQGLDDERAASAQFLQTQFEAEFAQGAKSQQALEVAQQALFERNAAALELRGRLKSAVQHLQHARDFMKSRIVSLKTFSNVLARS